MVELSKRWHPDSLQEAYRSFIEEFGCHEAASVDSGREALKLRTLVMEHWRRFPLMDVDLPEPLLPPAWPRQEAQKVFSELYTGLELQARGYFLTRLKAKPWV